MVKYALQTVLAKGLPRWGVDLQGERSPEGERGTEGFQVRYLEREV